MATLKQGSNLRSFVYQKHNRQTRNVDPSQDDFDPKTLKVAVPILNDSELYSHGLAAQPRTRSGEADQSYRETRDSAVDHEVFDNSDQVIVKRKDHINAQDRDEFHGLDDDFCMPMNSSQADAVIQEKLSEMRPSRTIDKHIEGDSYPGTTSGRLSDDDLERLYDQQRSDLPDEIYDLAQNHMTYDTRRLRTANGYHKDNIEPDLFTREDDIAGSISSFHEHTSTFVRANSAQIQTPASIKRQSAVAQPMLGTLLAPSSEQMSQADLKRAALNNTRPRKHDRQDSVPSFQESAPTSSDQAATPIHASARQGLSFEDSMLDYSQLDYDRPELLKRTFSALQAEDFDCDPRVQAFVMDEIDESTTLPTRLKTLMSLSKEHCDAYFYSLAIDEWEEAGDWFIEQFSTALTDLKNLRRQRRDLAIKIEARVEHRQDAIIKKRTAIANSLQTMRTNGAQVLPITSSNLT